MPPSSVGAVAAHAVGRVDLLARRDGGGAQVEVRRRRRSFWGQRTSASAISAASFFSWRTLPTKWYQHAVAATAQTMVR